jgi:hypothetical protein
LLPYKVKTEPCEVLFVLGVMEIEAWFISEHTHFPRISTNLNLGRIKTAMGFDPSKDNIQKRACPTNDLKAIYKLAKITYTKEEASIKRTLNSLNFAEVVKLRSRFEDLRFFIEKVDEFLAPRAGTYR